MQLLNSNIPQGVQNTKYSNKKAQDLLNLVLFMFCIFFVLQRCGSWTKSLILPKITGCKNQKV